MAHRQQAGRPAGGYGRVGWSGQESARDASGRFARPRSGAVPDRGDRPATIRELVGSDPKYGWRLKQMRVAQLPVISRGVSDQIRAPHPKLVSELTARSPSRSSWVAIP